MPVRGEYVDAFGNEIEHDLTATPAKALPFVTVGSTAECDYVTDGTADDVQLNDARLEIENAGGGCGCWNGDCRN